MLFNYFSINKVFLINIFVFIFLFIIFFQGSLYFSQAFFFGSVIIDSTISKIIVFTIAFFILILSFDRKNTIANYAFISLYIIFIFYGFSVIYYNDNGGQYLGAFLYNYSLTIVLLPLAMYFLKYYNFKIDVSIFYYLFLFLSLFVFLEVVMQKHVFEYVRPFLPLELVKFDQIGGYIRPMSFFKSPIDFSYLNAIFATLSLIVFIKRPTFFRLLVLLIFVFVQFLIFVRSGMVFLISSFILVFIAYVYDKYKLFGLLISLYFSVAFFVFLFAFFVTMSTPILNPDNLIIRFENWSSLLVDVVFPNFIFGIGSVQNGNYGMHHSLVIDNLYIGIFVTGGVISFIFFILVIALLFFILRREKSFELRVWYFSVVFGMLAASFFENTMHLFYFAILPLFFKISRINLV